MSLEGGGALDLGLNNLQTNEQGEVAVEAVLKVREDMQKAAQMGGQIAQASQQGKQFAQLLILLLQQVKDEILIQHIFRQLTEYKLSIPAIFAFFLPFIYRQVQLNVSSGPFVELLQKAKNISGGLEGVVQRMKQVHMVFPQTRQVALSIRVQFVLDLAQSYGKIHQESLDEEQKKDLYRLVEKELI